MSSIWGSYEAQDQFVWLIWLFNGVTMPDKLCNCTQPFIKSSSSARWHMEEEECFFPRLHTIDIQEKWGHCVSFTQWHHLNDYTATQLKLITSNSIMEHLHFSSGKKICKLQVCWCQIFIESAVNDSNICHISVILYPPPLSHAVERYANNLQMKSDA